MPRGDGTGPRGMGAMTGRTAGFCAGYDMHGFANPVMCRGTGFGRGWAAGYGGGRGRRNRFYATGLPGWMRSEDMCFTETDAEPQALKRHAKALQVQLDAVNKRLAVLESQTE